MKNKFRSNCPICSAVDIVGDKWALLIIRDMLLTQKRTFKEFSASPEGIATNILSNRLVLLEEHGIITKGKPPDNKKVNIYTLTERGLDLLPIVLELAVWASRHKAGLNSGISAENLAAVAMYQQDKTRFIEQIRSQFSESV